MISNDFYIAISKLLDEYQDQVEIATEEGLTEAAQVFIQNAKIMSPRKTGKYAKRWKMKPVKKKYKMRRYVGNTTTVKGKKSDDIPLISILEYSTVRGNKHVQKIFDASVNGMVDAIARNLKG